MLHCPTAEHSAERLGAACLAFLAGPGPVSNEIPLSGLARPDEDPDVLPGSSEAIDGPGIPDRVMAGSAQTIPRLSSLPGMT
jgi:hypothetical protein